MNRTFAILMTCAGIAVFLAVLFLSFSAGRHMAASYEELRQMDLNEDFSMEIYYDDHLYAQIGHGIIMDETVGDRQAFLADFLKESLYSIDSRILSAGIIYMMIVSALFAYPIILRYTEARRQIFAAVTLAGL